MCYEVCAMRGELLYTNDSIVVLELARKWEISTQLGGAPPYYLCPMLSDIYTRRMLLHIVRYSCEVYIDLGSYLPSHVSFIDAIYRFALHVREFKNKFSPCPVGRAIIP